MTTDHEDSKIKKTVLYQTKNVFAWQRKQESKKIANGMREIFVNYVSDKMLISKIHKELL